MHKLLPLKTWICSLDIVNGINAFCVDLESSSKCFGTPLSFLIKLSYSLQITIIFSFFPVLLFFISFSSHIALVKTFRILLNSMTVIVDINKNTSKIFSLGLMFARGFGWLVFAKLEIFLLS